jgi:hypothetical protein
MIMRISFILLLALSLTGCADLILPGTNRIHEERTASPATDHRTLVMSEPLDWFASESGDRYDIWLSQGTYHVEAEDSDYWYFRAPERVSLGKTALFSKQDSRTYDGGIFISKNSNPKAYPSGAYVDYEDGKMLLLFAFDARFSGQEGKRWHYDP